MHARTRKARLLAASCWASPCITARGQRNLWRIYRSLWKEGEETGKASLCENWNMFSTDFNWNEAETSSKWVWTTVQGPAASQINKEQVNINSSRLSHELIKLPCLLSSHAEFDQIKVRSWEECLVFWDRWGKEENSTTSWNWNKRSCVKKCGQYLRRPLPYMDCIFWLNFNAQFIQATNS